MGDVGEFFSNIYYRWKVKGIMNAHFNDFYKNPDLMDECSKWSNIPMRILKTRYYHLVRERMNTLISDAHALARGGRFIEANNVLERLFPESYDYKLVIVSKERKRINP